MEDNVKLWQGEYCQINQNTSYGIPGYLFVNSIGSGSSRFNSLNPRAHSEFGRAIGLAACALENVLQPVHVFAGKFGMVPDHALHFHVIPVQDWMIAAFEADPRWHGFRSQNPEGFPAVPDAAELIAFFWRHYCFSGFGAKSIEHDRLSTRIAAEIELLSAA